MRLGRVQEAGYGVRGPRGDVLIESCWSPCTARDSLVNPPERCPPCGRPKERALGAPELHPAAVEPTRGRFPGGEGKPSLIACMESGAKEDNLLRLVAEPSLLREGGTGSPWSVWNRQRYLEAQRSEDGVAPLHLAAERGLLRLTGLLLDNGVRVDLADQCGRTPLMAAAQHGRCAVVAALLRAGAAPGAVDKTSKQALHYTAHGASCANEVVPLLIRARADIDARDLQGLTPLATASALQVKSMVSSLLEQKASTQSFDREGRMPLDLCHASHRWPRRSVASPAPAKGACRQRAANTSVLKDDLALRESGTRAYWHWDDFGSSDTARLLLEEERHRTRIREPTLLHSERERLRAALPALC